MFLLSSVLPIHAASIDVFPSLRATTSKPTASPRAPPARTAAATPPALTTAPPSGLRSASATHRTRRSGRPVSPLHPPEVRENANRGRALVLAAIVSLPPWGRHSSPPSPTCTRRWPLRKHAPCYRQRPQRFTRPRLAIALTGAGRPSSRSLPLPKPRGLQHPPLCRAPLPIQRGAAPETLHPAFPNWHVRQEP